METTVARLNAALAGRYNVIRELGQGGMATVYLAEDLRHRRQVAIKVLRPELAQLLGAERFLREIEVVAGLHHPHILPLYDSGEAGQPGSKDTALYYVMPLVEGESLRSKLDREGQLPLDEALRYAREVADALSYAHARGVVHRDIKPDNIMIESGHAVVADFGIAKAVATAGDATALTGTGMSIGTPSYMSPEQAAGDREVDGRSDLYSLGCVLYEMLAGQPPFSGKTVEVLVRQHIMTPPPPVTQFRPAVPASVAEALARSLAKAPADRFNPVGQFAEALTHHAPVPVAAGPARPRRGWIAGAIGAVILMALVGWFIRSRSEGSSRIAPSIAVLPFSLLAADSTDASFILGMHGEIVTQLGKLPGLQVASRSSSLPYAGSSRPERDIANELGVANLLTGSLQRSGGQVRVNVALNDARSGRQLWAESYERELTAANLFAIQGDIAGQVAGALRVQLSAEQQSEMAQAPTSNLAALDFYHRALTMWESRGLRASDSAMRDLASRAAALDGQFVAAWELLSLAESWLVRTGRTADTLPARLAADRVHALAPGSLEDRLAAGYFAYYARGNYSGALRDIEAAQLLLPNSSEIGILKALLFRRVGRWNESREELGRVLRRDPRNLLGLNDLAVTHNFMRDFPAAEESFARFLAISPTNSGAIVRRFFNQLYGMQDTARARELLQSSMPVLNVEMVGAMRAFLAFARRNYREAATAFIEMGPRDVAGELIHPYLGVALAYHHAGDRVNAVAWVDSLLRATDKVRHSREESGTSDPFGFLGKVELDAAAGEAIRGNTRAAVALAERGAGRMPVERDAVDGAAHLERLSMVYILANQPEKALSVLEQLFSIPSGMSAGRLRFDPLYDPLRSNPRFQALLASR